VKNPGSCGVHCEFLGTTDFLVRRDHRRAGLLCRTTPPYDGLPSPSRSPPRRTAPPHDSAARLRRTTPPYDGLPSPSQSLPRRTAPPYDGLPSPSRSPPRRTAPPHDSAVRLRRTTPPHDSAARLRRTTPPYDGLPSPSRSPPRRTGKSVVRAYWPPSTAATDWEVRRTGILARQAPLRRTGKSVVRAYWPPSTAATDWEVRRTGLLATKHCRDGLGSPSYGHTGHQAPLRRTGKSVVRAYWPPSTAATDWEVRRTGILATKHRRDGLGSPSYGHTGRQAPLRRTGKSVVRAYWPPSTAATDWEVRRTGILATKHRCDGLGSPSYGLTGRQAPPRRNGKSVVRAYWPAKHRCDGLGSPSYGHTGRQALPRRTGKSVVRAYWPPSTAATDWEVRRTGILATKHCRDGLGSPSYGHTGHQALPRRTGKSVVRAYWPPSTAATDWEVRRTGILAAKHRRDGLGSPSYGRKCATLKLARGRP
jgi:hypothetical protein